MYNWYGLNQIDASYAINNTAFVDLCLSSIDASYHLLSSIYNVMHTMTNRIMNSMQ